MIYVFKTSVKTTADVQVLVPCLEEFIPTGTWTFDLDDCDKVLRIDSEKQNLDGLVQQLLNKGFECAVMDY